MVYEEVEDDIDPFLKLHKLSKAKGMGVKQIVNLLQIANNDLPALEKRIKRLRNKCTAISNAYRREKFISIEESNSINN